MKWEAIAYGLISLVAYFVMFFIGKTVNDWLHREYVLKVELTEKDNPALALAMVGYYFGLVLALGGAWVGPSSGLKSDLIMLGVYGLLSIALLNISWYVGGCFVCYRFKMADELVRDQNLGVGAVSAGISIASGFIIYGAVQGHGGGIPSTVVFWALGQVILVIAGRLYGRIVSYNIQQELEKGNVAAGVGFGGAMAALGIIIGLAAERDFISWSISLPQYLVYAVLGLILLPIIRFLANKILLPGVKLSDEIAHQEKPNLGAAYLEAFAYIASAVIIYWCV